MANYETVSVQEAAIDEVCKNFIMQLKNMDSEVSFRRLRDLVLQNQKDASFINIAGQYNSLVGHSTSADNG